MTVKTEGWPNETFLNASEYGRVRVDAVFDTSVGISICKQTSDKKSIGDGCSTDWIQLNDVGRDKLDALYDNDTIDSVDSERNDRKFNAIGWSALGLLILAWGLYSWRWKKRIALPEA